MTVPDLLAGGPWTWLVFGLVLIGLETVVPGVFLVWLGIAALLTGAIAWAVGGPWQADMLVFAALSVGAVLLGWRITRRRDEEPGDTPMLNRRGEALVGRVFPLDGPLAKGEGRIRVNDSVWRVSGPDLPAGTRVRVLSVDGANVVVAAE